ncbi:RNA polymerase sigma factor [Rothia sp. ZJ932]|uniref:RNA polymerase sigma factor n=1 Tax=Rothia sp. ZJ932 TaxID=2810516 RepID=UPI0019684642|nr:sigma factor [Rothia sp. ZJ932]QRZ61783.1 hypothetical protein JR346_01175 [Rothia sp. ZJ932]
MQTITKPTIKTPAHAQWDEDMLTSWQETKGIIASILYRHNKHSETEDVHQDTFLRAHENLHSYNPSKGTFKTWIKTIAYHQALDHITAARRQAARTATLPETTELAGHNTLETEAFAYEQALITYAELSHIIALLTQALGSPVPVHHTVNLLLTTETHNVATIASELGLSKSALYKTQQRVLMYAQTIAKALDMHFHRLEQSMRNPQQYQPIYMHEVVSCLPQAPVNSAPHFSHEVTLAVLEAGHVENLDLQALADAQGWSLPYTRRCVRETTMLFAAALAIIERGQLS